MFESRNRPFAPALAAALAGIVLGGCHASSEGPESPPPPTEIAVANFSQTTGKLPYPFDGYFGGTTDLTLNIPKELTFHTFSAGLNALDGWSTSSTIDTSFSLPVDPSSVTGSSVKLIKVWLDPFTKGPATNPNYLPSGATSPVAKVLSYGVDYKAALTSDATATFPDVDSGGKILEITPLKPLDYSAGPAYNSGLDAGKFLNVGYLVVLTNGLKAIDGQAFAADTAYESIKSAPADCSTFTNAAQKGFCQATKFYLGAAKAVAGVDPANVILTWTFSTQSVDDTLAVIGKTSTAQQTLIVPTGLTTKNVSSSLAGKADIYVGSTKLPYYQTPPASPTDAASVRSKFWTAAGAPPAGLDPTSRNLTMFNPVPAKVADVTVPVLVTIPNATSACPGKPAGGWPIAIVQHGVTGDRSNALAMADSFADACFVVAAIDLPLHGITNTANPLYCTPAKAQCIGATERTFDLDIQNNTTGVSGSDGKIDPSGGVKGTTYFYLFSPLTARDNLRQSEADLITFTKSVAGLAIAPGTPAPAGPIGVDATRVSYVGLSLGAIIGGGHLEFAGNITRTATLAVPGGTITQLLNDSQSFGPVVSSLLNGAGVAPGSYLYNLTLRDVQTIIDAGDPINHIADTQEQTPTHLLKVLNDTVVPNNSTDRLIAAGPFRKLKTIGPNAVGKNAGAYTFFSKGSHGSMFDPTASLAATVEMQKQAILFAASAVAPGGPFVYLTDPTVLDLN